jgi:choline-sulfatase
MPVNKAPNILMIMADQLSASALGSYGRQMVRTPNIDKLAGKGVLFENCYCNNPICVPSRASMVSGRFSNNIAIYDNGCELPASTPTFIHSLRNVGYKTILSGKMHFIGPDQLHGFEERLTGDI